MAGFLRYEFGGHWRNLYKNKLRRGLYFRNFRVCQWPPVLFFQMSL